MSGPFFHKASALVLRPVPKGVGGPRRGPVSCCLQKNIEADAAADDEHSSDAGYETDMASCATTSMSSSVRDYAFENSRRYHKFQEGRYHFPNDEPEQEREDMKHAMIV